MIYEILFDKKCSFYSLLCLFLQIINENKYESNLIKFFNK